jgi:hypothetical protein
MLFAKLLAATRSVYGKKQIIVASDPAVNELFGFATAISDDGVTIAVGAYQDSSTFTSTGAVYIFTKSGSTWAEQQKLTTSDKQQDDNFGRSVALSADGNTMIGGAPLEDDSTYTSNGAVYVFTRSGSTWSQQAKLLPSDIEGGERFGWAVALSDDGNTAIIGTYLEDTSPSTDNGAAYIFTRSGSTWSQQAKLTASDLQSSDLLGISVAISSDGNTAIVGASNESTSPYTSNGAAYVFTRSGSTWSQQAKLLATDLGNSDNFGFKVALSDNGNTAVIGAPNKTTWGAVYVFTRISGTWGQNTKINPPSGVTSVRFGYSVAISGDASLIMIGASGATALDNGVAYLYKASPSYQLTHRFTPGLSTVASEYGYSVNLSADTGAVAIVGYPFYNNGSANVGGVYIYS